MSRVTTDAISVEPRESFHTICPVARLTSKRLRLQHLPRRSGSRRRIRNGYGISNASWFWIPAILERLLRAGDPEPLHLQVKTAPRQAEYPRGRRYVAAGRIEGLLDHLPLEFFHRSGERGAAAASAGDGHADV